MILGEDWLEECSPMWVNWRKKIMKFTHKGKRISLRGVSPETNKCTAIGPGKLKGLLRRNAITHCVQLWHKYASNSVDLPVHAVYENHTPSTIPEVTNLLAKYNHLFQEPHSLPPERTCDQHIPLVLGAQPVNTMAYRFAPAQKNEIEK